MKMLTDSPVPRCVLLLSRGESRTLFHDWEADYMRRFPVSETGLASAVIYMASPIAHRLPRQRHKPFCFEARSTQAKDSWMRYARYVLANPVLRVMIKSYARTILKLDSDRLAGMRNRLVLTCTSVPDRVRGAGRIFQVARVHFEPTPDFEADRAAIERQYGPDLYAVQIMFRFDVPGYNGTYYVVEAIAPHLLKMVPPYPTPIFSLA